MTSFDTMNIHFDVLCISHHCVLIWKSNTYSPYGIFVSALDNISIVFHSVGVVCCVIFFEISASVSSVGFEFAFGFTVKNTVQLVRITGVRSLFLNVTGRLYVSPLMIDIVAIVVGYG